MPAKLSIAGMARSNIDKQLARRQQKAAANCGFSVCSIRHSAFAQGLATRTNNRFKQVA
jgi:hypothetical protein